MRKTQEEKILVQKVITYSSRCLEETNRGVKKSGLTLKKLSDLKERFIDAYRCADISYETYCTLGKILNNTIETIETTLWYFVD